MILFAIRLAVFCLLPLLGVVVCKADENVDYVKEVVPIFRSHCVACHAEDDAEGGLVMETYSRLSKGGFLFSTCTTFPVCWQRVGSRSVVAAQERDTHLEGMCHGVAVDQPELKIAQLAVFQLKIEHGLQVARDGFRVVSS